MNMKQWRLGLLIAVIIGVVTACGAAAGLDGVVVNWKFFFFFIALAGKDVVLFLKDHPPTIISGLGDAGSDSPDKTPQPKPVTPDQKQ